MQFKGKPTFTNKAKAGVFTGRNDFPDMGSVSDVLDSGAKKNADSNFSKKDQGYSYEFGSAAVGRREGQAPLEERKVGTKPIFTASKKKTLTGGANLEDVVNSRQNYDFSSLGGSTAKNTVSKPRDFDEEGEDGDERRPPRQYQDGEYRPPRQFQEGEERQERRAPRVYQDAKPGQWQRETGENPKHQEPAQGENDDFEVVTEKKRVNRV